MTQQSPIKYVYKPDPYSSHSIILSWLDNFPAGTRVLDVGTATGYIGKMIQHKEFELFGLEPEQEWLRKADPYYKDILCSDLEGADPAYLSGYQVVLLADVLEHMARPDKEVRKLISLQPEGATFIISVPNVANIWVRLHLLLGNFDYKDRGILDRTHLQFFTRKSFVKFLDEQGLLICSLQVTPIPLGLLHPFFVTSWLGKKLTAVLTVITKAWPSMFGFQWVAKCETKHYD